MQQFYNAEKTRTLGFQTEIKEFRYDTLTQKTTITKSKQRPLFYTKRKKKCSEKITFSQLNFMQVGYTPEQKINQKLGQAKSVKIFSGLKSQFTGQEISKNCTNNVDKITALNRLPFCFL